MRLPRISLGPLGAGLKPGPGLLGRRELSLEPGPQPGLVPLGVPAGLRHLLLRGPAHPVQLRPSRLGRLPRPRRVLPGLGGPGLGLGHPRLGPGRPGLRAAHRLVPLLPRRGHLLPRGPRLLLGGGLRRQRLGPPRLSLRCRSTRLPRISLGPLAAPPEREPRPTRIPRVGRPATLPGQHLVPPEPGQRQMRLPGHRVRQPAVPRLCRPHLPRPQLILTARIGASEDFLTGLNHRQAPFRSPGQRNRAAPGGGQTRHIPGNCGPRFSTAPAAARADELCAAASVRDPVTRITRILSDRHPEAEAPRHTV